MALKYDRQINLRIGDEEYNRLYGLSLVWGLSMAETVRTLINERCGPRNTPGPTHSETLGSGQE